MSHLSIITIVLCQYTQKYENKNVAENNTMRN